MGLVWNADSRVLNTKTALLRVGARAPQSACVTSSPGDPAGIGDPLSKKLTPAGAGSRSP